MSKTPFQQFVERNGGGPAFREPSAKYCVKNTSGETLSYVSAKDEGTPRGRQASNSARMVSPSGG